MLVPAAAIFIASMVILGGAGIAAGIVIALAGRGRNRRLAFWVTMTGIILSVTGFGFWLSLSQN